MRARAFFILICVMIVQSSCHRAGGLTLAQLEAQLKDMEAQAVGEALRDLFPASEGWVVLPEAPKPHSWPDSLRFWLEAPRVVCHDSLPPDAWTRFLGRPGQVEFVDVTGYLATPRNQTPMGFRGFVVQFKVKGIESTALLVGSTGMRWLVWLEYASGFPGTVMYPGELDSLGLAVSGWLASQPEERETMSLPVGFFSEVGLFPPCPATCVDQNTLYETALRHSMTGGAGMEGLRPDLEAGQRIIREAPSSLLQHQEPFLLQRRLEMMENAGWPGFHLSYAAVRGLESGIYLWAAGPFGQVRAMAIERADSLPESALSIGPSVLFYGRPLRGVGTFSIESGPSGSYGREIDAFPWEYGLSPYVEGSLQMFHGEIFFSRIGWILGFSPGPREGYSWPHLRTLPGENPSLSLWLPIPENGR